MLPSDRKPTQPNRPGEETIGERVRRVFRMDTWWRTRPHANDNQAPRKPLTAAAWLRRGLAGLLGGFVFALLAR
ncbi:MAG: hypothetical protein ACLFWF_06235 [Alphaproteobacteria bacterium]